MSPQVKYRKLGKSGIKVSQICLGTMMFGGRTDEADAIRIVNRAKGQGINFIDTADAYNEGRSEIITGKAIKSSRHDWVLATKVATPMGTGLHQKGLSRKWILQEADASLQRLGTDYIDIYYLHKEDHDTPLAETVHAIGDLVRHGKIRYFGVSNHRSWRIAEICNLCDRLGIDRPIVSQPYYNAMNRMPETEHLPACAYYGLGVVSYSPLARGVLTGKYLPDAPPPEGTRAAAKDSRMLQSEWRIESLQIAQEIQLHAASRGMSAGQFAINWVLNNRLITGVIAGPRTIEQWDDYMSALAHGFSAEDEAFLDQHVTIGHPSTPGYNDPAYPVEGRLPYTSEAE